MKSIHPAPLLKFALIADAVVSGAVAGLQLLLPQFLANALALPRPLLFGTGAFLLLYAAVLALLAGCKTIWKALIMLLIAGNIAWAVGCVALLTGALAGPSPLGLGFVAIQMLTVLIFAGLDYAGLKASPQATALHPAHA